MEAGTPNDRIQWNWVGILKILTLVFSMGLELDHIADKGRGPLIILLASLKLISYLFVKY